MTRIYVNGVRNVWGSLKPEVCKSSQSTIEKKIDFSDVFHHPKQWVLLVYANLGKDRWRSPLPCIGLGFIMALYKSPPNLGVALRHLLSLRHNSRLDFQGEYQIYTTSKKKTRFLDFLGGKISPISLGRCKAFTTFHGFEVFFQGIIAAYCNPGSPWPPFLSPVGLRVSQVRIYCIIFQNEPSCF